MGLVRNGCWGGRKAGNQLVAGGVPQKLFYEVCFGSRLRSDALKGETTRGGSRRRIGGQPQPRPAKYYITRRDSIYKLLEAQG